MASQDDEWREDRTAHWGSCGGCDTAIIIYPHRDAADDLPPEEDWEEPLTFIDCPVCGSSMNWGGTDHPADLLKHY